MSCHIWTMEILYWSISPSQLLSLFNLYKIMLPKMVCKKQKFDSSTECLYKLHWLPIHYRCIYKLMTIMYKTLDEQELQYLFDKLSFKASKLTTRQSSLNSKQLEVPFNRKRTQSDRGFSFTGPSHWNQLPNHIKEADNFGKFKKLLKTHYFTLTFN